ncbi:MAG: SOS response-associated peptidase [Deltaproteobacteria bacterium]|nr:SOS response-associated peptidase [Deltaproteobacteria bacterium]
MCGRFTLTEKALVTIADVLEAGIDPVLLEAYRPRYNIAPTSTCCIVRLVDGSRWLSPATWGFPSSAGHLLINARSETAARKPSFAGAFQARRCIVPADGFFEWTGEKKRRRPIWLHPPSGGLIFFAGLWQLLAGDQVAFTILTTNAGDDVSPIHDRMPAIVPQSQVGRWLHEPAADLLMPAPRGTLTPTAVSSRVNSVDHDDPSCLIPEPPEPPGSSRQSRLL